MFKRFVSICSLFLLSVSLVFGATQEAPMPPPRPDKLDGHSAPAKMKLRRAEYILSTLVRNPQDYQLLLSNNPSFGGEAVEAHVFADKPTIIIYQGALAPGRSNEELAFMMAHELGHLQLKHGQIMDGIMEKIFTGPPAGISGVNFTVFYQKLQEEQADLYGLKLYTQSGYDLNFFPYTLHLIKMNPNIHYGGNVFHKETTSLSMNNTHFNMKDRFELLTKLVQR